MKSNSKDKRKLPEILHQNQLPKLIPLNDNQKAQANSADPDFKYNNAPKPQMETSCSFHLQTERKTDLRYLSECKTEIDF